MGRQPVSHVNYVNSFFEVCWFVQSSQPLKRNSNGGGTEPLLILNSNGNGEVMRSIIYHLFRHLESFLNTVFPENHCRRKRLVPRDWLEMFAGLCLCSILKSLLIDAQVGIAVSDEQAGIAAGI